MTIIHTLLLIALVLFAFTGFLGTITIIVLLILVKKGANLYFGYNEEEDEE